MHWRMLPEITRCMYTDPRLTLEDQRRWFERVSRSPRDRVWIIELIDGDKPVGLLSLSEIDTVNRRCSWAYYIGDATVRGAGLAKSLELNVYAYVFETLGLEKLCCEVLAFNDRVVALHEKFGSKVEGTLRRHVWKNGEAFDVVRMGILRSEWLATREQWRYAPVEIESPVLALAA